MSKSTKHPLDNAYVRLNWAAKRLTELEVLHAEIINREIETAVRSADVKAKIGQFIPPGEKMDVLQFYRPEHPIPADVPVLIGEVLYNLRAALDYLVYELAALDSGSYQDRTQFPIEDTEEGFRSRRKNFLKFVNDAHAAAIERLQPYNRVNWTKILRTHSNPDKHRHLVIAAHATSAEATATVQPADPPSTFGGLIVNAQIQSGGREMYMNVYFAFFIAFEEGLPIMGTLEEIETNVAQVLADFRSEFQRT